MHNKWSHSQESNDGLQLALNYFFQSKNINYFTSLCKKWNKMMIVGDRWGKYTFVENISRQHCTSDTASQTQIHWPCDQLKQTKHQSITFKRTIHFTADILMTGRLESLEQHSGKIRINNHLSQKQTFLTINVWSAQKLILIIKSLQPMLKVRRSETV